MKTILLTGASKGLGNELLKKLSAMPEIRIVTMARSNIELMSERHTHISCDLSRMEDLLSNLQDLKVGTFKMAEKIIFINNAAQISPIVKMGKADATDVLQHINLNYCSPVLITNFLLSLNVPLDIVNISTGAAEKPIAGWAMYCSSKAANKLFFDVVLSENKNMHLVHVNPGVFDTGMQAEIRSSSEEDFPRLNDFIGLKVKNELKSAEEVADNVVMQMITNGIL